MLVRRRGFGKNFRVTREGRFGHIFQRRYRYTRVRWFLCLDFSFSEPLLFITPTYFTIRPIVYVIVVLVPGKQDIHVSHIKTSAIMKSNTTTLRHRRVLPSRCAHKRHSTWCMAHNGLWCVVSDGSLITSIQYVVDRGYYFRVFYNVGNANDLKF